MKVTMLLRRATSLLLALAMLLSFPVGVYSEGTGANPEEAPEIPEGYVWRAISVELAPFEEDRAEKEEEEAARLAEKALAAGQFVELMLSREAAAADEEAEEPTITVRGWMPEDVTAQAELIPYADKDLYSELALMQAEIRFYDGEGRSWHPVVPVTVCVEGKAVQDAVDAKMEPTVYVYREEAERVDKPDEKIFSVTAFSASREEEEEETYELEQKDRALADVCERALRKDEECPNAVCFELDADAARFVMTLRQSDRTYLASTENDETEIVVVGALPRDLSAAVESAPVELDADVLPGDAVQSWKLSLVHPEEPTYLPDVDVKVALRNAALAELEDEDWELQLWELRENETPVRVRNARFQGETVRFTADDLTASYVVVRAAVEKQLTASDDETYAVRVSYDVRSGIPAGAELQVREILPEDEDYEKFVSKSALQAGCEVKDLEFARVFDVTLRDPETGVEYQPTRDVKLSIDLLSEEAEQCASLSVVRFGEQTECVDAAVSGSAVAFETGSASVYVVMGTCIEHTITAEDGSTYQISVTYDKHSGIPADAELQVRELIGEEYMEYLTKTAEFLSRDEEQLVYTRFFDITIVKDGVEYEPDDTVSVSIRLLNRPETQGVLRVVHFGEETELLENVVTPEGDVTFNTKSFSIYAITDEDGETVLVPRAFYQFYNFDGTKMLDRQIIKNGGTLRDVEGLTNPGAQYFFLGWYVKNSDGSWGEKVVFNTPIQVFWGNTEAVHSDSVVVPKTVTGNDNNDRVVISVGPRYTTSFATIYYMDDKGSIKRTDKEPIPDDQSSIEYQIPDVSNSDYTVTPTPPQGRGNFTFYGWSKKQPDGNDYYTTNDGRQVVTKLTLESGNTYTLYPVFKKGHWVSFFTAPAGSGAEYLSPVFVAEGTNYVTEPETAPEWRGYKFLYWTATPTFDEEGNRISFSEENKPAAFDFNHTEITEDTILYAYWEAGYTTYTVIYWRQKITDDRDAPPEERTYEFGGQETREAKAGELVELLQTDKEMAGKGDFVGFHHKDEPYNALDVNVDKVSDYANANGSTVLSVYYDRNVIYMKFINNGGNEPAGRYEDPGYLNEPGFVAATDNTTEPQYGLMAGEYVRLTRKEKIVQERYWTYQISYGYYNTQTYTIKDGDNGDSNGKFYVKRNNRYSESGYSTSNPPPETDNTTYYCYAKDYWGQWDYRKLTAGKRQTTLVTWYLPEGEPYQGAQYNGSRYVEDATKNFWYYGLFGQDLGMYGYHWPSDRWSYYNSKYPGNGFSTGMTFLGQFILPSGVKDTEGKEMRLYNSGRTDRRLYFYLQDTNGKYDDENANYTGNTYSGANITFTFSEKFDGFSVSEYRFSKYQATYADTNPPKHGPFQGNWKTAAVNQTTEYYSTDLELNIRFARNKYSISYFDGMDGQALTTPLVGEDEDPTQVRKDIYFGADVNDFYPNPEFEPIAKEPGYSFNHRWYLDAGCTTQAFFYEIPEDGSNPVLTEEDRAKLHYYTEKTVDGEDDKTEKAKIYVDRIVSGDEIAAHPERKYGEDPYEILTVMPSHDLGLYAGFSKDVYVVQIDPNGGSLNGNNSAVNECTDFTYLMRGYGETVPEYEVKREYIYDPKNGTFYYHCDKYDKVNEPNTRLAYYTTDASLSTDGTRKYRPVFTDPNTSEGFEFLGWYKVDDDGAAGQKYSRYNFGSSVTGDITIRAMWRQMGEYRVYYSLKKVLDSSGNVIFSEDSDPNAFSVGGNCPYDDFKYADGSTVAVKENIMTLSTPGGKEYDFLGWYYDNDVYSYGEVFVANGYLADKHPEDTRPNAPYNTFILYPVFQDSNAGGNSGSRTTLVLDANGGHKNTAYPDSMLPKNAHFNDTETQLYYAESNSEGLLINMDANLPVLPLQQNDNNVFLKDKAEFLGWAFSRTARMPKFKPGQTVGVDNDNGDGFNGQNGNILYAVWRPKEVDIKIQIWDSVNKFPVSGGKFELKQNGKPVPGTEKTGLTANEQGYLATDYIDVITLKTPTDPRETTRCVLTEVRSANGYIPLPATVTITVDYNGTVTYKYDLEDEDVVQVKPDKNDIYLIRLTEKQAICKIVEGKDEHLFATLNDALTYVDSTKDRTATIQMIRDYKMPSDDFVQIMAKRTVTLTTAPKKADHNPYLGEGDTATIMRNATGDSMFTVNGAFILNNVILDGGSSNPDGAKVGLTNGGIVSVENGQLTVSTGAVLQNSEIKTTDDSKVNGAAILVKGKGSRVDVTGGEIRNCSANGMGGAIYAGSNAVVTVKNGSTITDNTAETGAGIYVSADARLEISGAINFGGTGVTGDSLNGKGNISTLTLGKTDTNAVMPYVHPRQDIYLSETGEAPATLVVTGNLTGEAGSIWVWAEHANHYQMVKPFASFTGKSLSEDSYKIFRNAREDRVTYCSGEFLTGQPAQEGQTENWVYWTGGLNVKFWKVDGFGNKLTRSTSADGAKFRLFVDRECMEYVMQDNAPVTAMSNEEGLVSFEKIPAGIFYMQETDIPNGYELATNNKYIVLIGETNVTVPEVRTGVWANELKNIEQSHIDAQIATNLIQFELGGFAIFPLDENDVADPSGDIAGKGIVNVSTVKRPVILSKINTSLEPLTEGQFILRSVNGAEIKVSGENFDSDDTGIFFAGLLPVGTYLLEEKVAPRNAKNASQTFTKPNHYFVFRVTENGVMVWRSEGTPEDEFALSNTVTPAESDKYLIP